MACRRRALLLAACALIIRRRRLRRERKARRRFWVRPIFTEVSKLRGEWENLVSELKNTDREYFFKYLRMSPERFEHLFSLVAPSITKEDTKFRKSIPQENDS